MDNPRWAILEIIESMFVEVGVMDHREESMRRISISLGMDEHLPAIEHMNQSTKKDRASNLVKNKFREKNETAFKVYGCIHSKYCNY